MKKIFLLFILLAIVVLSYSQVGFKGYNLGDTYFSNKEIYTTLGGQKGILTLNTLKDGRIYQIIFIPSPDGRHVRKVSKTEIEQMILGVENKFDIIFRDEDYEDGTYFVEYYKDGIQYFINWEGEDDYNLMFSVFITNISLQALYDKQQQDEINKDF